MGKNFTKDNKCTITAWKNLTNFLPENDKIKYIVWQIEVGKKERPHIQGYVQFNEQLGLYDIKNAFNDNTINIEFQEGSFQDNYNYCTKKFDKCRKHSGCKCDYNNLDHRCDKCNVNCERIISRDKGKIIEYDSTLIDFIGPFEGGEPEKHVSFEEKKLNQEILEDEMLEDMKAGESYNDFVLKYGILYKGWLRTNFVKEYFLCKERLKQNNYPKCYQPLNFFFFGDPGTGKSFLAKNLFPLYFTKNKSTFWSKKDILSKEGRILIMNELNPQFIKWETFLQLTSEDRVPVGAYVSTMYNIFNSNYDFDKIFNNFDELITTKAGIQFINLQHKEALYRRFQYPNGYIIKFEGNYERDGLIRRTFIDDSLSRKELELWKDKFNNYEFDVRFSNGISLVEAQKYEFKQGKVFEENNNIYYRQKINYKNEDEIIIELNYNQDIVVNKKIFSYEIEDLPFIIKRKFDDIIDCESESEMINLIKD